MDYDAGAPERSPAHTLEMIADGGRQLLLVARERLRDIEGALDAGRFEEAMGRAQELMGKLQPLASAEGYMAIFATTFVVRADHIEEGMVLHGLGKVTAVSRHEHPNAGGDGPCIHVALTCEDHEEPVEYHADRELVVLRSD